MTSGPMSLIGPNLRINRARKIRENSAKLLQLRVTDPANLASLLAQNCVKRGTYWLNRNAPNPGWWRNCLDGGRSRVRMSHDNAGILSLVFEYERNMADQFGYVIDAIALRKLGFGYPSQEANRLGFSPGSYITGWTPFPKRYPGVVITSEVLDKAWAAFLEDPPSMMRINYRHQTSLEAQFAQREERLLDKLRSPSFLLGLVRKRDPSLDLV